MVDFDFRRFLNVTHWMLAVNSKFYTRTALLIFGFVLLPVLYQYLLVMMFGYGIHPEVDPDDTLVDVIQFLSYFSGPAFTVILCYSFHSLVDRQGRVNEFTLPASNMEKFAAHIAITVLGTIVTYLISLLAADVVNMILRVLLLRHTGFTSLTAAALEGAFSWKAILTIIPDTVGGIVFLTAVYLLMLCGSSVFVLMSVWRYRHTLAYLMLYLLVFFFASALLIGIALSNIGWEMIKLMFETDNMVKASLLLLFAVVALSFIWIAAFRLYCHGQITTKRNP